MEHVRTPEQDKSEWTRRRAHELWESEGRPEGRHDDHWHQAEQEAALDQEQGFDPADVQPDGLKKDEDGNVVTQA